jgi:hypothetical protein
MVVEIEGLESRSGLIMDDLAYRQHELEGWRAFSGSVTPLLVRNSSLE